MNDPKQASHDYPNERAFLHALSTPLSTLGLELDHLMELVKTSQGIPQTIQDAQASVDQMRKVLNRVFLMIQERRAQLPPKQS
jgi:hypothetical protein